MLRLAVSVLWKCRLHAEMLVPPNSQSKTGGIACRLKQLDSEISVSVGTRQPIERFADTECFKHAPTYRRLVLLNTLALWLGAEGAGGEVL